MSHRRRSVGARLAGAAAAALLVVAACSGSGVDDGEPPDGTTPVTAAPSGTDTTIDLGADGIVTELVAGLTPFSSCDALLERYVDGAQATANASFSLSRFGIFDEEEIAFSAADTDDGVFQDESAVAATEGGDDLSAGGIDYSTTNIQEIGVDEPDSVKTDGQRLFVLDEQTIRVVDVRNEGEPRILGSTQLPDSGERWSSDMMLDGDRLLVLAEGSVRGPIFILESEVADSPRSVWRNSSTIYEYDVSTDTPQLVGELELEGRYVTARMVDGVVRIVVVTYPEPVSASPYWGVPEGTEARGDDLRDLYNQALRDSTIDDWLPRYQLRDANGQPLAQGSLTSCERVYGPSTFSGVGSLNVLTVDMRDGGLRGALDGVSVLSDGDVVYASTDGLYVTTQQIVDWAVVRETEDFDSLTQAELRAFIPDTEVHKFDITDPTAATYVASGTVSGTVLNQYSMSEFEGNLRIATTVDDRWFGRSVESESFVTVFAHEGDQLVEIGQVGNLGLGERIYSVRFMGDIAAVVTFRQTDPLYTIDLTDPTNPTVLGELKILGYSAYLHPLGNGRLLGVGQDATEQGRTQGTQVSLFDISDLTNPIRTDNWTLPDSQSGVEWDPRAFLYWAPEQLTVLPVNRYGDRPFFGVYGLRIGDDTITEVGDIRHHGEPRRRCQEVITWVENEDGTSSRRESTIDCWFETPWDANITRSVVVGDFLFTVSGHGIAASNLSDLGDTALVTWPS